MLAPVVLSDTYSGGTANRDVIGGDVWLVCGSTVDQTKQQTLITLTEFVPVNPAQEEFS